MTIPRVAGEFVSTQKFKSKYPWRSDYRAHVVPISASAMFDEEYQLFLNLVKNMLDSGVVNEKNDRLFDLSSVDKEAVSYALSKGYALSTGDQGIIDFASQEFPDDFVGNYSPLELVVDWLTKGIIEWDDTKHSLLGEWAITSERPQPARAKAAFQKIVGRPYLGP